MPTSPAATTMPGGAPLTSGTSGGSAKRRQSKRSCKYGPRDADGLCPKKPRSSGSSSRPKTARAKPPCKYGPRGDDGYCPKKPKVPNNGRNAKAPTVRDYESVDRAAKQAGQVLRSKKATKEQKHEAVRVLGEAVAGEVAKKTAEHIGKEARDALKKPETQEALKKAAVKAAPLAAAAVRTGLVGLGIYATLALGGRALTSQREKESARFADAELAKTQAKVSLTKDQAVTLWKQYFDFKMKQPVTNSFVGK